MTQAELQTKIEALNTVIATGVTSTAVDGTSVSVDLKIVTEERDRLQAELVFQQNRRPRSATMRIW